MSDIWNLITEQARRLAADPRAQQLAADVKQVVIKNIIDLLEAELHDRRTVVLAAA